MMLMSMRPMAGSRLPFICDMMARSAGSALSGKVISRKFGLASSRILFARFQSLRKYGPVPTGLLIVQVLPGPVLLDHLPCNRRHRRLRQVVHQHVVGFLEAEPDRVAVERLHAFDFRVVVQLAGLLRLFHHRVGARELVVDIEQVRRAHPGVEQPLPGVDVVVGDQFPPAAAERRVVGEEDPFLIRMVQVRPLSVISGSAAAVLGTSL